MRIAIPGGGGAMGGIFGACLSRGGADVALIDVPPTAIDSIADAKRRDLEFEEQRAAISGIPENAASAGASMLQDVEARRQTEIEVINGAFSTGGRETGVPAPVTTRSCRSSRPCRADTFRKASDTGGRHSA